MELGLENKTVIVTGGGSNVGRAICLGFAREKCNVAIAEIDEAQGNKVAGEARSLGAPKAICIKCDVTKWDQVQDMVKKTLETFGTIDVLVNSAGGTYNRLFIEMPREQMEEDVQLNLWGIINCIRAVLDHMTAQKKGTIINIAGDAGRMGEYQEVVYSGCKGASIAMTKSLARELGPRYGIRVNAISPGTTPPLSPETVGAHSVWAPGGFGAILMQPEVKQKVIQRYPLRKLGKPEDIANAVVFLASDVAAGFITGQTLSVSGGYTMM